MLSFLFYSWRCRAPFPIIPFFLFSFSNQLQINLHQASWLFVFVVIHKSRAICLRTRRYKYATKALKALFMLCLCAIYVTDYQIRVNVICFPHLYQILSNKWPYFAAYSSDPIKKKSFNGFYFWWSLFIKKKTMFFWGIFWEKRGNFLRCSTNSSCGERLAVLKTQWECDHFLFLDSSALCSIPKSRVRPYEVKTFNLNGILVLCVCWSQGNRVAGLHSWGPAGSISLWLLPRAGLWQRHQEPPEL